MSEEPVRLLTTRSEIEVAAELKAHAQRLMDEIALLAGEIRLAGLWLQIGLNCDQFGRFVGVVQVLRQY